MKNVCIVGFGAIGPIHAAAIKDLPDVNFYAICDIVSERADKCAKRYHCKAFYDFDEMLCDDKIDVVHICTPHYLHKEMTLKALKSGKDVVLEKPVAMNPGELDEILAYLKTTDRRVGVMLQNRTNNSICALKNIMETDPSIGKLLGVKGILTWKRDAAYYQADEWRGKWSTEGGGLLINQAVHTLDLLTYLAGKITSVRASISTKLLDDVIEVEDTADALLHFENGIRGCFYATNTYPVSSPPYVELIFENVVLRYSDNSLYKIYANKPIEIITSDDNNICGKAYWGSGHKTALYNYYQALKGNSNDYISIYDAENSARALFAIYESGKNNSKEVTIWK